MKSAEMNSKVDYFNGLADGWDEMVGNNGERAEKIRKVFSMIDIRPGDDVLDVGCGTGILIRFIEEKTGNSGTVTALDPARCMIDKAREFHEKFSNIEYVTGFIESAPLPLGRYDAVICYAVLPHIDDLTGTLARIYSLLKEDGRFYILHPACTKELNEFHSNLNSPVKHDILPEEQEIRKLLLEAGFEVKLYIDEPGLNFVECLK